MRGSGFGLAFAGLIFWACNEEKTGEPDPAGCHAGGQAIEYQGVPYCVYPTPDDGIIETGFADCAAGEGRYEFDAFVACGSQDPALGFESYVNRELDLDGRDAILDAAARDATIARVADAEHQDWRLDSRPPDAAPPDAMPPDAWLPEPLEPCGRDGDCGPDMLCEVVGGDAPRCWPICARPLCQNPFACNLQVVGGPNSGTVLCAIPCNGPPCPNGMTCYQHDSDPAVRFCIP